MNRAIRTSVRLFSEGFSPRGPVIEIGSYRHDGADLSDMRPYFRGLEYIGCDIRPGPGVDRIEDGERLSFADASCGTVLILETLEHVADPHRTVAEARRVLSPDGLLVISVPFNYRLHGFPTDYWRFTSSGVHQLLNGFGDVIIFALGPRVRPTFVFAVATPSPSPQFEALKAPFRRAVQETFERSRWQGRISVLKERSRDLFGFLLGRADLDAVFFDPAQGGGYTGGSVANAEQLRRAPR
jgi:SAM-dependent methyltransferase